MGKQDKASNKIEELKGRVEQKVGRATGNKDVESQGKTEQIVAAAKNVGEAAKDVEKKVKEAGATARRVVKR
jgi:uncharacterized protein YjbJ (UPF0337 family)